MAWKIWQCFFLILGSVKSFNAREGEDGKNQALEVGLEFQDSDQGSFRSLTEAFRGLQRPDGQATRGRYPRGGRYAGFFCAFWRKLISPKAKLISLRAKLISLGKSYFQKPNNALFASFD